MLDKGPFKVIGVTDDEMSGPLLFLKTMTDMKKQTVFIDLKGYLIDYLKFIFTETKTRDVAIQSLKTQLNVIIREVKEQGLLATAENCEQVWKQLTATVKEANIENVSDPCYKEIVNTIDNIGKEIAYLGYRKGWKYRPMEIYSTYNDEELMEAFKIIILNQYNDTQICPKQFKTHKEYVDTFENKGYYKMTDEELLVEAKKMAEYVRAKREEKVTFKATGTEDIRFFND